MTRRATLWAVYGLAVLAVAGLGMRLRAAGRNARDEAAWASSQAAEMRRLVGRLGSDEADGVTADAGSVGSAVQRAAAASGLGPDGIDEVSQVDAAAELGARYRVRLSRVRSESLVRFVHALEADGAARVAELEMSRADRAARGWDVVLLLSRAP